MGIYVQCFADLPDGVAEDQLATRIAETARAWAESRGLQDLFFSSLLANGVWLSFFPPAGGFALNWANGRIQFDAKTSVAGPGYHAALVDLCDRLQAEIGLKWRWDAGGDQTGYALDRDVPKLFRAFADQFYAFCEYYEAHSGTYKHHALNLPEGLAMDGHDGVATPLGPLPVNFFIDAKCQHSDPGPSARQVFPWWDLASQLFWPNTLRALLWTDIKWRAPRTPWETFIVETVHRIAKRVDLADQPQINAALRELNEIVGKPDESIAPAKEGIGYHRHKKAFFLPGAWRINLPGYYTEQDEDDGSTTCLWFGTEEVRGSSFTVTLAEGGQLTWSEMFSRSADRKSSTLAYRVLQTPEPHETLAGHFTAWAEFHTGVRNGTADILLLSLFGPSAGVVQRLEAIANDVWFNAPEFPERRGDA
jgi:hypothetical protein